MGEAPPAPVAVRELGSASSASWWLAEDEPTPELRWPYSIAIYDAMRRQDAQVASVLRAVTLPVRRTPWRLDPDGARDEVTQLVAEDLGLPIAGADPAPLPRARDRFSWAEHLRLALLELVHGHSIFEQLYRIDGAGKARLRKLAWRPPRTISKFNVAADGGLDSIEQHAAPGGDGQPVTIPVDRLVAYVHDREGGTWQGQSLLRPAYKFWRLKDPGLRTQAQTLDRNGMGVPVYEAAPGETDLTKGHTLATGFRSGANSGAAIANGAKLYLRGVDGNLPDAEPVIRYYDEQIARAVLAHFLNLGTQTGSWALGSTFADFFTLSLQGLGEQIADTATQHIVEDLVDLNFGPEEPAPRIVFDEIGSRQAATAQAVKMLIDAGAVFPDRALEEALRQQYGLPPKALPAPVPA